MNWRIDFSEDSLKFLKKNNLKRSIKKIIVNKGKWINGINGAGIIYD